MILARDNPFSTDRVLRQRYRWQEADWARLFAALEKHGGRGALVGPKGSGKTTLIEDLAGRLRGRGYQTTLVYLTAETPGWPAALDRTFFGQLGRTDAVLVDGAEQLPWLRWLGLRWRLRHAAFLVVTTHRRGRLPTVHRCTTTPALLHDLVRDLGAALEPAEAARLHRHHRGNLREALRELYDHCAEGDANRLSLHRSVVK